MMRLVIDTNAYSGFMRGQMQAVSVIRRATEIHVPLVVMGELLAGFSIGSRGASNRDQFATFLSSPRVNVLKPDEKTAHQYASIYLELRRAGTPVPTNDMWIAALARQHRLPLLTFDRHFQEVPELELA